MYLEGIRSEGGEKSQAAAADSFEGIPDQKAFHNNRYELLLLHSSP